MHIAEIAPPWFPIPPVGYGGIERVVNDVTEGLVAAGERVTLLAPIGSQTSAQLIETGFAGAGLDLGEQEKQELFLRHSRFAYDQALLAGADLIHDHTDFTPDPGCPVPVVRTIHGPAVSTHVAMYAAMSARGDYFVAISERQRELFDAAACDMFGPGDHLRFAGVVHNPVDIASTPFYPPAAREDYLAFVGRCHWEKDPVGAIQVAMAAGVPLKMALRITDPERPYFDAVVQPALRQAGSLVEFVGEVGGQEKADLIGRARAVVFSSPWEEPFGLILAEAGAHGTPLVALRRGAAPEVVRDGVNGYLADDLPALARCVPAAMALDPVACRDHIAAHFSRSVIAARYLAVFTTILAASRTGAASADAAERGIV